MEAQAQQNKSKRPVVRKEESAPPIQTQSLLPGEEIQAVSIPIEKFEFTIPESVRKANDPKTVVLKELTEPEIDTASKLARGEKKKEVFELVKASLVSVDGRVVNHGEAEADVYWARWGLKVKYLLTEAWQRINTTSKEDDRAFFDSMTPV